VCSDHQLYKLYYFPNITHQTYTLWRRDVLMHIQHFLSFVLTVCCTVQSPIFLVSFSRSYVHRSTFFLTSMLGRYCIRRTWSACAGQNLYYTCMLWFKKKVDLFFVQKMPRIFF
jgi:hypothetical protein